MKNLLNFKKIDEHTYEYELDDNIHYLVYKDNTWYYCGVIYQGAASLLLNDLKKATCFLEIREAYIKIKMLPLINYNELNDIKVF